MGSSLPGSVILTAGVCVCAFAAAGCFHPKPTGSQGAPPSARRTPSPFDTTRVKVTGAGLFERDKNGPVWEIHAPETDIRPGSQLATIYSVDAVLYDRGKRALHVRAPRAVIDNVQHLLVLEQGVKAESLVEPASFSADQMQWKWKQTDGVTGRGNIRLSRGRALVTAGQMSGDPGLRRVRLFSSPSAVLLPAGTAT